MDDQDIISYKISGGKNSRMLRRPAEVDGATKFTDRSSTELSEMPFTAIRSLAQNRGHGMVLTEVSRLTKGLRSSELALRFKMGVATALDYESELF